MNTIIPCGTRYTTKENLIVVYGLETFSKVRFRYRQNKLTFVKMLIINLYR